MGLRSPDGTSLALAFIISRKLLLQSIQYCLALSNYPEMCLFCSITLVRRIHADTFSSGSIAFTGSKPHTSSTVHT